MAQIWLDVRFGSLADIRERIRDVRFTPKSGHGQRPHQCLQSLTDKSLLWSPVLQTEAQIDASADHVVGVVDIDEGRRESVEWLLTGIAPIRSR